MRRSVLCSPGSASRFESIDPAEPHACKVLAALKWMIGLKPCFHAECGTAKRNSGFDSN